MALLSTPFSYPETKTAQRNLLLVMQARILLPELDRIRALHIDKVWFRGYNEKQLETAMPKVIEDTNYDNYILLADDTLPEQKALDCIVEGLLSHEIITGYSNTHVGSPRVNLCRSPLRGTFPGPISYDWMTFADVSRKEQIFQTYFMGFSLTGMRRELWRAYPFKTVQMTPHPKRVLGFDGWGSDFMLSKRLHQGNKLQLAHKDAFVVHTNRQENFIVGKIVPETVYDLLSG
jgi:hypothetical protein